MAYVIRLSEDELEATTKQNKTTKLMGKWGIKRDKKKPLSMGIILCKQTGYTILVKNDSYYYVYICMYMYEEAPSVYHISYILSACTCM